MIWQEPDEVYTTLLMHLSKSTDDAVHLDLFTWKAILISMEGYQFYD